MTFCGHHSDKLTTLSSWRHVLEAKRVGLRILNFGGDAVDTRSATGRLMLNMFAAIRPERRHEPAHALFPRLAQGQVINYHQQRTRPVLSPTHWVIAHRFRPRFDGAMDPHFITVLTGRNLPKIRHQREPEPSIINEKTVADFTRVVELTGILKRETDAPKA